MIESAHSAQVATAIPSTPPAATVTDEHPGRWLGGLVGAVLSLALAGAAWIAESSFQDVEAIDWIRGIGLLGIPVGFVLGRGFLPAARSAGWRHALVVGLGLGWLAPPLGAPLALTALFVDSSMCEPERFIAWFAFLMYAVVISFVAIVVTIPIGIIWAVVVRALPGRWLAATRMPAPVDRLGSRHLLVLVAITLVAVVFVASPDGCAGSFS